jgi:hypothetical protein
MNGDPKKLSIGCSTLKTALVYIALILGLFFAGINRCEATIRTNIGGITISYSGTAGSAYFDPTDETLTIEIPYPSGSVPGSLTVTVGPDAPATWSSAVDIYILADDATFKSINIKGTELCTPFICGNVDYCSKFALLSGVIGSTASYGPDFGLGIFSSFAPPVTISLKNSYTTAQLFGFPNLPPTIP